MDDFFFFKHSNSGSYQKNIVPLGYWNCGPAPHSQPLLVLLSAICLFFILCLAANIFFFFFLTLSRKTLLRLQSAAPHDILQQRNSRAVLTSRQDFNQQLIHPSHLPPSGQACELQSVKMTDDLQSFPSRGLANGAHSSVYVAVAQLNSYTRLSLNTLGSVHNHDQIHTHHERVRLTSLQRHVKWWIRRAGNSTALFSLGRVSPYWYSYHKRWKSQREESKGARERLSNVLYFLWRFSQHQKGFAAWRGLLNVVWQPDKHLFWSTVSHLASSRIQIENPWLFSASPYCLGTFHSRANS